MQLKYEVFVGGKEVLITNEPERNNLPSGWLMLQVSDGQEVKDALELLRTHHIMKGLHLFADDPQKILEYLRSDFKLVVAAGGLVLNDRKEILAIHRLGVWDLPKGKVDKGESIEDAAIREVKEECGLHEVQLGGYLTDTWHTYERNGKDHLKRTVWYLMHAPGQQELVPQTEEDIQKVEWMGPERMDEFRANTYKSIDRVLQAWQNA